MLKKLKINLEKNIFAKSEYLIRVFIRAVSIIKPNI